MSTGRARTVPTSERGAGWFSTAPMSVPRRIVQREQSSQDEQHHQEIARPGAAQRGHRSTGLSTHLPIGRSMRRHRSTRVIARGAVPDASRRAEALGSWSGSRSTRRWFAASANAADRTRSGRGDQRRGRPRAAALGRKGAGFAYTTVVSEPSLGIEQVNGAPKPRRCRGRRPVGARRSIAIRGMMPTPRIRSADVSPSTRRSHRWSALQLVAEHNLVVRVEPPSSSRSIGVRSRRPVGADATEYDRDAE